MAFPSKPPEGDDLDNLEITMDQLGSLAQTRKDDCLSALSEGFSLSLAQLMHGEAFEYFGKCLFNAGMSINELKFFRAYVFGQLIGSEFYKDESALVKTLALVLNNFYCDERETSRIVIALEENYNRDVSAGKYRTALCSIKCPTEVGIVIENILKNRTSK